MSVLCKVKNGDIIISIDSYKKIPISIRDRIMVVNSNNHCIQLRDVYNEFSNILDLVVI